MPFHRGRFHRPRPPVPTWGALLNQLQNQQLQPGVHFPFYYQGAPGTPNISDIAGIVAQLTNLGFPPIGIYSARYLQNGAPTTNALVGPITRWDDARGRVGFGPSLVAIGAPTLAGSGPSSYLVKTNGTNSALASAFVPAFDLSIPKTLISVRVLLNVGASYPAAFNPYVGLTAASNAPYLGFLPTNTLATVNLECPFLDGTFGLTTPPTIIAYDGRVLLEVLTGNGTAATVQGPPNPIEAITQTSPASGAVSLAVGTDGTQTLFGKTFARALIVLPGVASAAAVLAAVQWAVQYETAINDAPRFVFFDGDSLTDGFGLTDGSQSYPVQMMALAPFTSGWAYCQTGTPFIELQASGSPTLNSRAATIVDPAFNYSQVRQENICVIWGGTNDMAGGGASAAATFGFLQTYVNARLAVGWKVVIVTCIDRGDVNIDAKRAIFNPLITSTYGGGAVPNAAVADASGNPNLGAVNAWMNTTFFQSDKVHLTPAGYAIVAPLVQAAIVSIL